MIIEHSLLNAFGFGERICVMNNLGITPVILVELPREFAMLHFSDVCACACYHKPLYAISFARLKEDLCLLLDFILVARFIVFWVRCPSEGNVNHVICADTCNSNILMLAQVHLNYFDIRQICLLIFKSSAKVIHFRCFSVMSVSDSAPDSKSAISKEFQ